MKRLSYLVLFTIFLSHVFLQAQVKPQLENEWAVAKNLGPIIDGTSVRWSFLAIVKTDVIDSIRGFERNGEDKKDYFIQQKKIEKGKLYLESQALNEIEYQWIFESGNTSKFFTIELKNKDGEIKSLHIPINFSEQNKENLRLVIDKNFGIKKELTKVPFHRNFDGRKWVIGHSENDENISMIELFPGGVTNQNWSELYRFTLLKKIGTSRRYIFVDAVKAELAKDCSDLYFNILKETDSEIIFEWSHDGCGGYPTGSEISRMVSNEEQSLIFTFASNQTKHSKNQKEIYLSILENEK
ncbi:hypothetical protein EHQ42_01840 [Leptospira levettii]|uniref:hypothetical protein n=1 Tax=Leptospira levettii TaxID=2023178 RepID=UPI0010828257|nr:hypothetical protein [Leptospira levettii]TGL25504.1 hypothetical protein EHQ42_01840 [Leptospira levettii]